MEFIRIKNKRIVDYISTSIEPKGKEWVLVDGTTFEGSIGQDINRIDLEKGGILKPDEQLLQEGIIEDNRGTYYNTVSKTSLEITSLDTPIPEGYTTLKPEGVNPKWLGDKWVDAGDSPTGLFSPFWDKENGWYEGAEQITEEMKKTRRKSLLNDYMFDLLEEGTYSIEAMQEKASELKELIK